MSTEQRILYKDNLLKIVCRDSEEHEGLINEGDGYWVSYILQRGLLKEFSIDSPGNVQRKLYNATPFLLDSLNRKDISSEKITRIFAQARINELEEEVSYFIDNYNRAEGLIE